MSFGATLSRIAGASGLAVGPSLVAACEAHYQLLVTWNRTHNLTRIVAEEDAVRLHYLDCLAPLLAWPAPKSMVDVGSGAGFPGLLAWLAWPDTQATLVEPAKKRASFLVLAAAAMGLGNGLVRVVAPGERPLADRVLSRATFSPGSRQELTQYAAKGGEIVVWGHPHDAPTWQAELSTWGWSALPEVRYRVEGVEERCLLRGTAGSGA